MNKHRLALIIASAFAVGAAVAVPSPEPEPTTKPRVVLEGWTVIRHVFVGFRERTDVFCKNPELDYEEQVVRCPREDWTKEEP